MTADHPPRGKRIAIGVRPPANPQAEAWVRQGDGETLQKGDLFTARLTLDVTPAMRARIKVSAFTQGTTVAELLRALMDREFPESRSETSP
ncbi:chromosome partitioning protein ParB [Hydrogenophaga sp.]|uniref:chromosome partitioning protein ParB n=1 Tax=Hydrogenophaga sp. TaxID=1904254 RepID=UPI0027353F3E|nr:chromosome partitioning protein ParB [Hydrogenophaga sp.]MDP3885474.1 chromosome partitioning protein ParB [Hydrogenophaga sp.]MDZ4358901.1 chromosome partitioning protein ParB [Variovorax sp.]